jgi:hypothetical protein
MERKAMSTESEPPIQRYIVRKHNWRRFSDSSFQCLPGSTPVNEYLVEAEAEQDRWQREQTARVWINPFRCGQHLGDLTLLPEYAFRDWLLEAGIDLPSQNLANTENWANWWNNQKNHLTAEQRERVWAGLGKIRFFSVEVCGWQDKAYCVIRVLWEYNDQNYEPGDEGGTPLKLFRRYADAKAQCELLEAEARAEFDDGQTNYSSYENERWQDLLAEDPSGSAERLLPPSEARFYEIVEISTTERDT